MIKQYIFVGYPFAGKTTLAKEIEKRFAFQRYNVDEIKEEFGYAGVTDDKMPDDVWEKIFNDLDNRVEKALRAGKTVINEYAWVTKKWRDRARKIADKVGVETVLIFVDTPESVVRERWIKNKRNHLRFDVSENDFEEAIAKFEKPTYEENITVYSEKDNLDDWIEKNITI